ncbi:unnamed protein product [Cylindrotheca closterium]|uniref:Uncharacterized protein n=1 Tax=Cylindrotheca closterium TaxID=2856 RepID=A0AAD2JMR0_9STRA|nr:unnamed protein product [Cylindrotheca closterium]
MTAAVTALYSPPGDNPWSTASPCNAKDHKEASLSLAFRGQKDYGLWNSTPKQDQTSERSWGTAASAALLDMSFLETPTEVEVPLDWLDEVSILNDNPEEDDIEVLYLPTSTYNVLVPLFNELYIEDSTEHDDNQDDGEDDEDDSDQASVAS